MNKKKLLEYNHGLFQELENIKASAEALQKENALLRKSITELENENKLLKNFCFENGADKAYEQFNSDNSFSTETKSIYPPKKHKIKLPPMTDYAASIIGKIVVSAAKKCNILSSAQDNPDTKDLINLLLGRTEISKAEILKIISTEDEISIIKNLIDQEHSSAEDYFESVMAQL